MLTLARRPDRIHVAFDESDAWWPMPDCSCVRSEILVPIDVGLS